MLVENCYPADTRVRNEATALTNAGYRVHVIALRGKNEPARQEIDGVSVHRIPRLTMFAKLPDIERSFIQRLIHKLRVVVGYLSEYVYFTLACLFVSLRVALTEGVDAIHAHNPPDTLFIVGAFHKLLGKKFVYDHHDLSPELYRSRYKTGESAITKVLGILERCSVRLADTVIATNESYKAVDIARNGAKVDDVFIVRNGPDLNRVRLVAPDQQLRAKYGTILGYIGAMNPQDGVDYLLRALARVVHELGRRDFYCVLIGDGDSREELIALAEDLKISDRVLFTGFIPDADVVRYLSTADICLDPNPSSPLNDVSTWIKVMEYMALGKPLVSFDLKETRVSAAEAALYVPPNDEHLYADAIVRLMDDPLARARMGAIGRERVESTLSWQQTSKNLIRAYAKLFGQVAQQETEVTAA